VKNTENILLGQRSNVTILLGIVGFLDRKGWMCGHHFCHEEQTSSSARLALLAALRGEQSADWRLCVLRQGNAPLSCPTLRFIRGPM
jgi:hypothetical protein